MKKNRIVILFSLLMVIRTLTAQVNVRVQAPSEVVEGDRFRVSYVVNTQDIDDFSVGEFQGVTVDFGPTTSRSSSYSMVNGKTTSSSSTTFTYTLSAHTAGSYHMPAATVTSGGKTYKSALPAFSILPAGSSSKGASQQSQTGAAHSGTQADRMHTQNVGDKITGKDLFIAVTASKRKVFEQEAVLLTYKLYTLVNVSSLEGKMPELDGFHVQELNRQRQPELKMEHYNGKNYGTVVWSQYVVFPQQTGTLTIPEIKYEATVVQQNRSADPFDIFFGGGSMVQEVRKTVIAPAVTLQVAPLPSPKPENYSGAVGKFSISATLTPQSLKANDATTLRVTVNGTGNIKLIKAPQVDWPKDFERYDPKSEEHTSIGPSGSTGKIVFDYIAVPRHKGQYDLPPVQFCYFDPEAKQYRTLQTEAYTIDVTQGSGRSSNSSGLSKEDIQLLNSDIRYIQTSEPTYLNADSTLFASRRYWAIYAAAFLAFVATIVAFRRRLALNADVARRRTQGANKIANRRLKAARRLLQQNKPEAFYDEAMRALWGYVADKLNIPTAQLTKDNVTQQLQQKNVQPEIISLFVQTLDECEFARFAPGDPAANMENIYNEAAQVITRLQDAF